MPNKKRRALADPSRLSPFDKDDKQFIQAIIETPRGSRNKFAFDPDQQIFELKKVLPAGMTFPYDFGFVPSTRADDGDPIDVLVWMEEPVDVGCLVKCRLVGVIEGEQEEAKTGRTVRNDRLLAIERANHEYAEIKDVEDFDRDLIKELEEFFVNYHKLDDNKYRVLTCKGRDRALKLLKKALL